MNTDPIADYLTRVRNAIKANHRVVEIPASNIKKEITKVLYQKGYIQSYRFDDAAVQEVPRENFQGVEDIQPGMQFQSQTEDGHVMLVTVKDVQEDKVIVDANHPLAGKKLHFDVEVASIRDASDEELQHGHVHGAGGHHH